MNYALATHQNPNLSGLSSTYELLIDMYESALAKHKVAVTTNSVPNIIHILLSSKNQKKLHLQALCGYMSYSLHLYQMSNSLVKGNLSIRAIHTFFNAIKQNLKSEI